jgi:hypothetical protein
MQLLSSPRSKNPLARNLRKQRQKLALTRLSRALRAPALLAAKTAWGVDWKLGKKIVKILRQAEPSAPASP